MKQNKSLTIRIPYGDEEIAAAATAIGGKKNRETLRKFLVGAMQSRMANAKQEMAYPVEATANA
jgi:hypothetical protein